MAEPNYSPNEPEQKSSTLGMVHAGVEGAEVVAEVAGKTALGTAAGVVGSAISGVEAYDAAKEGNAAGTMYNMMKMVPLMGLAVPFMMTDKDGPFPNEVTGMTDREERDAGYQCTDPNAAAAPAAADAPTYTPAAPNASITAEDGE